MDEITALGQPNPQNLLGNNSAILGKDDFLKILVTQLRNQDPSDPLQADEFAVQLAQFSSVEQLQNISSLLQNSIQLDLLLNQAINNTMATTLIGKQVRAAGDAISHIEGQDTEIHYRLSEPAASVRIQIRDEDGNVVRTISLQEQLQGNQTYSWDGKDDDGQEVPVGKYHFSVTAQDFDGNPLAAEEFVFGTISSVRYQDGNAILRVGEVEINLTDVIEISSAEDASNEDATDEDSTAE
ncbi:MAG: flagellar hook assembly protein FlgD [bacterium]